MGYDESCSRKLSARNPVIANATSKSPAQRSLCSCREFSSQQYPPSAVRIPLSLIVAKVPKGKPVRISDLHVEHHFMAMPWR